MHSTNIPTVHTITVNKIIECVYRDVKPKKYTNKVGMGNNRNKFKQTTSMKIHVPSMLAIGVETINKQTQQTNKQPQWLIKFIKHSHKGLRKY